MKVHHHLKHIFIPHEGNEYRPHFFREISIAIILTIVFIIVSISASSAYVLQNTDAGQGIVARVLIDLTNQNRSTSNLSALVYSPTLEKASQMKAGDMAANGYFAHNSPAGLTPWHWLEKAGYNYRYAGENLAVNFTNSEDVSNGWMNSPTHRANILSPDYKEIGISMASGMYQNNNTIFVVQMFGTPVEAVKVSPPEQVVKDNDNIPAVTKVTPKKEAIKVKQEKVEDIVIVPVPDASLLISDTETAVNFEQTAEVRGESTTSLPAGGYASEMDKTIFNSSKYASIALTVIFIIVFSALCVTIFIEIEKQHPRHIIYGVSTLIIVTVSIYTIKNVFELQFILL
jgi:uncharacterized protein YkwD